MRSPIVHVQGVTYRYGLVGKLVLAFYWVLGLGIALMQVLELVIFPGGAQLLAGAWLLFDICALLVIFLFLPTSLGFHGRQVEVGYLFGIRHRYADHAVDLQQKARGGVLVGRVHESSWRGVIFGYFAFFNWLLQPTEERG